MKNILIAGASGFIGKELVSTLSQHNITVVGRSLKTLKKSFEPKVKMITWDNLTDIDPNCFDIIINLAGYNISDSRWNTKVKKQILDSRINSTKFLVDWIIRNNAKPHIFCANGIGVYRACVEERKTYDEESQIDEDKLEDFSAEISIKWQQALQPAIEKKINVTIMRFGVVLKKNAGILKKLYPSFNFGLGAILGDGQQIFTWVHIDDVTGAFNYLINNQKLTGPVNIVAPEIITQKQFAQVFAKILKRPLFLKLPSKLIEIVFGEMGQSLLLRGQAIIPKKLIDNGYKFKYPDLAQALAHEFGK